MQKKGFGMNWFEFTEQKRKLLISGTITLCLAMLIVSVRRNVVSFDGFWHLQAGLDWLEHGLSPWIDHFSFTFYGQEITNPPYAFQAALAWLVNNFGLEPGFQIYRLVAFLSLIGVYVAFLRILRSPAIVYCLVLPLVVVLVQFRTMARPEIVSYVFSVLAMLLYYRTRNAMTLAGMLPIIGLMWLWNNYHTPIIGYIIFFGYFVDIALKQIHDGASARRWLQWLGWGIAIVAVGFLIPDFKHPLLGLLHFSSEWNEKIFEYIYYGIYFENSAFYVMIVVAALTLVLLAWRRQFGLLIVCLVLTYSAANVARLIAPSGLVILCAFAWVIKDIDLKDRLSNVSKSTRNVIGLIVLVLTVIALGSGIQKARFFMKENISTGVRYPKDVVDYMVENEISGRIFNEYGIGGFLIYHLSPDLKVYIDGRTNILYPIEHLNDYFEAQLSSDALRSEIEKYDIDLTIMGNNQNTFTVMHDTGLVGLDFVGSRFSLFKKNQPNFPILGKLLTKPACWNETLSVALEQEKVRASAVLPDYSPLLPFMHFVLDYSQADDKVLFLKNMQVDDEWTIFRFRFAAYQALSQNLDELALQMFEGLAEKIFSDILAISLAKVRLGEWKVAEEMLDSLTRTLVSEEAHEVLILHGLLVQIRQNAELELFNDAYLQKLVDQTDFSGDKDSFLNPNAQSFCPTTFEQGGHEQTVFKGR